MSPPTETTADTRTSNIGPVIPRTNLDPDVLLTDQTNLLPFKQVLFVFSGLALCILVSTLDSVIVATALPTVSAAFQAGSVSSWVPSAYLLTSTCFQPLYGRFSDIFGRKSAFCIAMAVFMIGNLVAGFSRSIIQLIVFRGFAGAGGGGIISMAQIVISDVVSLRERGKYQGIIGGTVALGFAIGPVIGGALSQKASWRWCFWIDIPISFAAMCVVIFVLPLKPVHGNVRRKLLAVDYVGVVLTLSGCALVILPLIWGGVTFPWKSAVVLAPLLSGFVVIVIFCLWEWKGARLPIVPMYIFKHVTVTGVYITMFINGYAFYSSLYYLPLFFQVGLGYSPLRGGIFLIPLLISQMVASWTAGVMVSRTGRYRTIIYLGFTVWSIASGCLSTITVHSSKVVLVVYMLLAGAGAGLTLQTTIVAAQASVSRKDMSVVTVFRNFVRLLGGTMTLAISSTLLNNSLTASMRNLSLPDSIISKIVDDPSSITSPASIGISASSATYILNHGFTRGIRLVFILNAALTAAATVASVLMIKHKELTRGDEEALRKANEQEKVAEKHEPSQTRPSHDLDVEKGSKDHDSEAPK